MSKTHPPTPPPPLPKQQQHNTYLSSYAPSTTTHHEWRNAQNSASHLLPHLTALAAKNPNLTLLDIGAGSGTIAASLASYIPQGLVIATDISEAILAKAKRHAESVGVWNVGVRRANVYELPFRDGEFDVVHASMVLAHLDDARGAVVKMVRVVIKPGGILSLRESDLRMWSIHPASPLLLAFNKMLCAVHTANGGNIDAGAKLVSWLLDAGVERDKIVAGAGTWCYSTPEERSMWGGRMREVCAGDEFGRKAVELGVVGKEELGEMERAWGAWVEAEDGWFGCMHGEVVVRF